MTLKEFNYNGFEEDDHLNPDGTRKPWPHKRKVDPNEEKRNKLISEIKKLETQLTRLNKKIANTKNQKQKFALTNDRRIPLIAKIQNLKSELKKL